MIPCLSLRHFFPTNCHWDRTMCGTTMDCWCCIAGHLSYETSECLGLAFWGVVLLFSFDKFGDIVQNASGFYFTSILACPVACMT